VFSMFDPYHDPYHKRTKPYQDGLRIDSSGDTLAGAGPDPAKNTGRTEPDHRKTDHSCRVLLAPTF
ncbi:MAG TPA: hypothetical protein VN281_21615, partial [Verrucomicrobiae bacterium]|nr:hypothetical protein [Verrucomicrobiae bacterium]